MDIAITDIEGAEGAAGTVVVIDVIRAFTTAAVALAAGAERIICVEHLAQAHELRHRLGPDTVLMGEERGRRPEGFDLGNEPDGPTSRLVAGRTVVQRTTNGTRGLSRARSADHLLAASAVTAGATVRWITTHRPHAPVTLVTTGSTGEDRALARHLRARLQGTLVDPEALAREVRATVDEHVAAWRSARSETALTAFRAEVDRCAVVDRFDLALVVGRDPAVGGHPVMTAG